MVHYKPVKITIDAPELAEIIIYMMGKHPKLVESIVSYRGSLLTSKFWSLLRYFFDIKPRLFTAFYSQTDG